MRDLKGIGLICGPLLSILCTIFLVSFGIGWKIANVCGVCLLMVIWWIIGCVPIGITSLLPIPLFPVLGILEGTLVSKYYFSDSIMILLGSLFVASAIEKYKLHEYFAKLVLKHARSYGSGGVLLGIILSTGFLSMFLSNSATAALMSPLAKALYNFSVIFDDPVYISDAIKSEYFRIAIDLGIAYSASLGGIATLTGTGSNVVLLGVMSSLFSEEDSITYTSWFLLTAPFAILNLFILWVLLCILYVYPPRLLLPLSALEAQRSSTSPLTIAQALFTLGRTSLNTMSKSLSSARSPRRRRSSSPPSGSQYALPRYSVPSSRERSRLQSSSGEGTGESVAVTGGKVEPAESKDQVSADQICVGIEDLDIDGEAGLDETDTDVAPCSIHDTSRNISHYSHLTGSTVEATSASEGDSVIHYEDNPLHASPDLVLRYRPNGSGYSSGRTGSTRSSPPLIKGQLFHLSPGTIVSGPCEDVDLDADGGDSRSSSQGTGGPPHVPRCPSPAVSSRSGKVTAASALAALSMDIEAGGPLDSAQRAVVSMSRRPLQLCDGRSPDTMLVDSGRAGKCSTALHTIPCPPPDNGLRSISCLPLPLPPPR